MDKRRAVHQRRCGPRWTALALVHPAAGMMIKAAAGHDRRSARNRAKARRVRRAHPITCERRGRYRHRHDLEPRRGATYQPRATPWGRRTPGISPEGAGHTSPGQRPGVGGHKGSALKGRDMGSPPSCHALSGLSRITTLTQGAALGSYVRPRWGRPPLVGSAVRTEPRADSTCEWSAQNGPRSGPYGTNPGRCPGLVCSTPLGSSADDGPLARGRPIGLGW